MLASHCLALMSSRQRRGPMQAEFDEHFTRDAVVLAFCTKSAVVPATAPMAAHIPAFPAIPPITAPNPAPPCTRLQFALNVYPRAGFPCAVLSRGLPKITLALMEFALSKISAALEGPGSVSRQMAERSLCRRVSPQPIRRIRKDALRSSIVR